VSSWKRLAVSLGCSQRRAAQFVDIDESTVRKAPDRDPDFRAQLDRAAVKLEIDCLQRIRDGEKTWRSSAWLLENACRPHYGKKSRTPQPPPLRFDKLGPNVNYAEFFDRMAPHQPEPVPETMSDSKAPGKDRRMNPLEPTLGDVPARRDSPTFKRAALDVRAARPFRVKSHTKLPMNLLVRSAESSRNVVSQPF
jgi:hypothetical protein